MLKCCLVVLSRCNACHHYEYIYVEMVSNNFYLGVTFVSTMSISLICISRCNVCQHYEYINVEMYSNNSISV